MTTASRHLASKSSMTFAATAFQMVAMLAATPLVLAGPGDLDPSFGDGGRVFVDIPNDIDVAATVVLQADGKLVVGRKNEAIDDDFSVLRFNADGSHDMDFDADGRTSLDFSGIKGTTHVVLQQADGKIVAAGTSHNTIESDGTDFGLARYNANGSVDTSFGVDGVVIHDLGSRNDVINAIVQQADGRLVAAGYTYGGDGGSRDIAFVRFNADGTLDASFGSNGSTIINFHNRNGSDDVRWLTQQGDGKLVAVGTAWPRASTSKIDIAVVRLNPDGLPDLTFDGDGRVVVDLYTSPSGFGGDLAFADSIALQPDGRIVVAGTRNTTVWSYDSCLPWLARLNPDGSLDTSFGEEGTALTHSSSCVRLHGLSIAPNSDIYLAGGIAYDNHDHFVARVTPTGGLDPLYGVDGLTIIDVGNGNNIADTWYVNQGIILQPDGKIVTAVSTSVGDWSSEDAQLVVSRLLENGDFPGVLGLKSSPEVSEASGVAQIAVRRTAGSFGAVTVDYETSSIDATSGADFTGAAGTLTWTDSDVTDKIISISIVDDTEIEEPENFKLNLSNASRGVSLATTELMVRIEDDDSSAASDPPHSPPSASPPALSSGSGAIGVEALIALMLLLLRSSRATCRPNLSPTRSFWTPIS